MDKWDVPCWYMVMQPSARDKRIRSSAGIVIIALSLLSVFMIFSSNFDLWSAIPLAFLYGLQSLFMLGAGVYLAGGRGKAGAMVLIPGRWRLIGLAAIALVGAAATIFGFTAGPKALMNTALWPNMVGVWVLLQFRSRTDRFPRRNNGLQRSPATRRWIPLQRPSASRG